MTGRIAVVGYADAVSEHSDGSSDAELLAAVVDSALAMSGVRREDVGVVCSAGYEFAGGVIGSMMDVLDVLPCWPPPTHTHLEGDGAFASYEAWVRLLAGEAQVALVCAFSRPVAEYLPGVLGRQLDPYVVEPLHPSSQHIAALQARALLDTGRYTERDFAAVVSARRPGLTVEDVLAQPYVSAPLRALDCSTTNCSGMAALVLAVDGQVARAVARPAWIAGMDQRVESGALGSRDLTRSVSTAESAQRLGLRDRAIDVLELHAPYSHQELMLVDAIGARAGSVNPSGGALPADPIGASGLMRIGAAATAVLRGEATTAVGHAGNGPGLQHNLLCLLVGSDA